MEQKRTIRVMNEFDPFDLLDRLDQGLGVLVITAIDRNIPDHDVGAGGHDVDGAEVPAEATDLGGQTA